MKIKDTIIILAIVTFMSLFSNVLGTKADIIQSIPGLLILAVIAFVGMLMSKYIPGVPGSDIVNGYVKNVGFVALCTPILAYAGVSIGKDLDDFAKTGWRIVILAIVVFVGTYIASAIIAQCILKALGQI